MGEVTGIEWCDHTFNVNGTKAMHVAISRGEARAIVAAIRERAGMKVAEPVAQGALL